MRREWCLSFNRREPIPRVLLLDSWLVAVTWSLVTVVGTLCESFQDAAPSPHGGTLEDRHIMTPGS